MLGISTILDLQEKNIDILGVLTIIICISMVCIFVCCVSVLVRAVSPYIERSYKFFNKISKIRFFKNLYYIFWFRVFRATQPDVLNVFLKSFAEAISAFEEAQKQIDDVEYAMLNSKIENLQLRDKVTQLKKNFKILAEEFQGHDFIDVEFSAWIRASQTINTLIEDRIAYLNLIEMLANHPLFYREASKQDLQYFELLKNENKRLKVQVDSLQEIRRSSEPSELQKHQEKVAKPSTTQTEVDELRANLRKLQQALDKRDNELNNLEQCKIEYIERENQKLAEENNKLSAKEDELNNLKNSKNNLEKENQKLAEENNKLSAKEDELNNLKESKKKLEQKLAEENNKLSAKEDEIKELNQKYETQKENSEELSYQLQESTSIIEKYKEDLKDKKQKYEKIEGSISKIRQNYETLKHRNEELHGEIQKLEEHRNYLIKPKHKKYKPGYNNSIRERLKKSRRKHY